MVHVRFRAGENPEIKSKDYLSLFTLPLDSLSVLLGAWIRCNRGESASKQLHEGFLY